MTFVDGPDRWCQTLQYYDEREPEVHRMIADLRTRRGMSNVIRKLETELRQIAVRRKMLHEWLGSYGQGDMEA